MSDAERPEDILPDDEPANDVLPEQDILDGDVEQDHAVPESVEGAILPEDSAEEPALFDEEAPDESNLLPEPDEATPEPDSLPESTPMAEAAQDEHPEESTEESFQAAPTPPASPASVEPVQLRQRSLPAMAVGALLVALGVIFVWPVFSGGYILIREVIIAITIGGIALSLLAYWLYTGRKARGALFLALLGLSWAGLTGMMLFNVSHLSLAVDWPFYIVLAGLSILLTTLGDRLRDNRLMAPGIILVIIGGAMLAFTRDVIPTNILNFMADYWPWIALVLVIGMLPIAIRRVPKND